MLRNPASVSSTRIEVADDDASRSLNGEEEDDDDETSVNIPNLDQLLTVKIEEKMENEVQFVGETKRPPSGTSKPNIVKILPQIMQTANLVIQGKSPGNPTNPISGFYRCRHAACPRVFDLPHELETHLMEAHHWPRMFVCDQCGEYCCSKSLLSIHLTEKHGRATQKPNVTHVCQYCSSFTSTNRVSLTRHITRAHPEKYYTGNLFWCVYCDTYRPKAEIKSHVAQCYTTARTNSKKKKKRGQSPRGSPRVERGQLKLEIRKKMAKAFKISKKQKEASNKEKHQNDEVQFVGAKVSNEPKEPPKQLVIVSKPPDLPNNSNLVILPPLVTQDGQILWKTQSANHPEVPNQRRNDQEVQFIEKVAPTQPVKLSQDPTITGFHDYTRKMPSSLEASKELNTNERSENPPVSQRMIDEFLGKEPEVEQPRILLLLPQIIPVPDSNSLVVIPPLVSQDGQIVWQNQPTNQVDGTLPDQNKPEVNENTSENVEIETEDSLRCPFCIKLETLDSLMGHINECHAKKMKKSNRSRRWFRCSFVNCVQRFRKVRAFLNHHRTVHMSQTRHVCRRCAFATAFPPALKRHIKIAHPEANVQIETMLDQIVEQVEKNSNNESEETVNETESSPIISCPFCAGFYCFHEESLQIHLGQKHPKE